jgi:GTPase SAR1 family protein
MGCTQSTPNNPTANNNSDNAVRLKATQTGPKINQLNLNSAKVVLLGESAVGKSSICERFVSSNFQSDNSTTIGKSFHFLRIFSFLFLCMTKK